MAPTLPALLCLGEMRWGGGSPGLERPPQPACSIRGPQTPGGSRGGEALLSEGTPLTGRSLPGLSVGLRTQVQAGESVPGPSSLLSWGYGSPPGCGERGAARGSWSGESGRSGLRAGAWGGTPREPASDFLPGTFRKPIIWAEPSSVVPSGSPVTIWCQGPLHAKSFSLKKEGSSAPWNIHPPLEPWDKASFSIRHVTEQQAGRYHCSHFIGVNWSEPSETLELLVAGEEPAGQLGTRLCTGPTGEPQG